jgi:hypothetical protein
MVEMSATEPPDVEPGVRAPDVREKTDPQAISTNPRMMQNALFQVFIW